MPLGGEFQVNSYTASDQTGASIALGPTGDLVVAWDSSQKGSGRAMPQCGAFMPQCGT